MGGVAHARGRLFAFAVTVFAFASVLGAGLAGRSNTVRAAGVPIDYPAGWNLVGGPQGTVFNTQDSAYTFGSGNTSYDTLPAGAFAAAGVGYWVYFDADTTVTLNGVGHVTMEVPAPAGQYFMVGNPDGVQPVRVSGADALLAYDPATQSYDAVTTLLVGQGAWAFSYAGGPITMTGIGTPLAFGSATPITATATPTASVTPPAGPPLAVSVAVDPARTTVSGGEGGNLVLDIDVLASGAPVQGATVSGALTFYTNSTGAAPGVTFGPEILTGYTGEVIDLSLPPLSVGTPIFIHVDATYSGLSAGADAAFTVH